MRNEMRAWSSLALAATLFGLVERPKRRNQVVDTGRGLAKVHG
jgi:hypothetical protein